MRPVRLAVALLLFAGPACALEVGKTVPKIGTPDLRNALDALLAGRPIEPAVTKAFGCSIARS